MNSIERRNARAKNRWNGWRSGPVIALTAMFVFALFDDAIAIDASGRQATVTNLAPARVQALHVPAAVANGQAPRLQAMAAEKHLSLALNLPVRNQPQLEQLLSDLQNPSSPNFHHYLTTEEYTEYFAPTQADYDAVIAWATAAGMAVTSTVPNRRFVLVDGPVSKINQALHVAINEYQHPREDRVFFSTDSEPTTTGLSVALLQIGGLSNFTLPHPKLKQINSPIANLSGSGPGGQFVPSDMRAAYYGSGTLTGAGQTIGILSFDGYPTNDLAVYYSNIGSAKPSVPVNNVLVNGYSGACVSFNSNGSINSTCDDGEQILDIVNAIGMAPGITQILFYEGDPASSTSDTQILNKMATDNIAKSIGCSWGWGANATADDAIFQQMGAQGQTFFNATGDNGAFSADTNYQYPSVSKYIIQVGGTDLVTAGAGGAWSSETGWTDSGGGFESGTTIPSWQQLSGVINASNKGSTTLRNSPDVAMEANFDNPTVSNGQFLTGYGGTSFAAPRWAGYAALINQQSVMNGNSTIGFFNPALYNLGVSANYTAAMHDITSGTNQGTNPSTNRNITGAIFSAVTGFDLVTGWGSPKPALITALAGTAVQPSGSLTINKTVTRALPVAATFNFTISCTNPSNATPISAANQTPTIAMASGATTGTATVTPIAASSTCSVSETAPTAIPNYTWGATPAAVGGLSITANTTSTAAFTNTLSANPGTLTVTKTISGVASSVIGSALTFPFTVACATPTASYSGSVTVAVHTLTATSAPISLPAGTTSCTISEGARPAAPTNYAWGTAGIAQPASGALAAGASLSGTITNPLAPIQFAVVASAGANGSVSPGSQVVNAGSGASVTITPNSGYSIGPITGTCGGTLSGNVYTIPSVSANCSVNATFSAITYSVTATAGPNGTISPGSQIVNYGASASVTATAAAGYTASVSGDTCTTSYAGNNVWTTSALHANCNLTAGFAAIAAGYVPLVPARILDTRIGFTTSDGAYAGGGAVLAGGQIDLAILGRGGVASSGVNAVVLNVTATNPTKAGFVTVWPTVSALPNSSNLNVLPAQTIPNLVVVKLGSNGEVSLYNAFGSTDLIADVVGYFSTNSDFTPLVPARLLDTRSGATTVDGQFAGLGALPASGRIDLTIEGRDGIPASGVNAAILNVTATDPTAAGFITAWPSDAAQPFTSNLNFVPGQTIPNLVIAAVSAQGQISLFNSAGATDLVADVMGWFPSNSQLTTVQPARLMDTRPGTGTIDGQAQGAGPLTNAEIRNLTVTGRGNIPASGVGAVVINVTVTAPTANGFLTVWPTGSSRPTASNLNFVPSQTIANLVIAKVGSSGQIALYNSAGSTDVIVDVVGWFPQ